jgi:fatty-acyl-CoA synthase
MTPLTSNLPVVQQEVQRATLSHHNILNNGYIAAKTQRITEDKIVGPLIPLLWYGIRKLSCISRATMIYPNETFDAEATLKQFLRKKQLPFMEYPRCFAEHTLQTI